MIEFIELSSSAKRNTENNFVPGKGEDYNIGYIYTIIIIIIIVIFVIIHTVIKELWRNLLKDRLLEDGQALTEYEKFKMEQEIEKLKEENKKIKSRN